MTKDTAQDTRYPYTYAADLIRSIAGYDDKGTKLSRADASHIRSKIADIIGIPDGELASKLADYYLENQEKLTEASVGEFLEKVVKPTVNRVGPNFV